MNLIGLSIPKKLNEYLQYFALNFMTYYSDDISDCVNNFLKNLRHLLFWMCKLDGMLADCSWGTSGQSEVLNMSVI
jgi:hypothetical protein